MIRCGGCLGPWPGFAGAFFFKKKLKKKNREGNELRKNKRLAVIAEWAKIRKKLYI